VIGACCAQGVRQVQRAAEEVLAIMAGTGRSSSEDSSASAGGACGSSPPSGPVAAGEQVLAQQLDAALQELEQTVAQC
jgi:hypothetical protein